MTIYKYTYLVSPRPADEGEKVLVYGGARLLGQCLSSPATQLTDRDLVLNEELKMSSKVKSVCCLEALAALVSVSVRVTYTAGSRRTHGQCCLNNVRLVNTYSDL